jgi:hypothetical protein
VIKAIILRDNFWDYDEETLIEMVNKASVERPPDLTIPTPAMRCWDWRWRASHQSFATSCKRGYSLRRT